MVLDAYELDQIVDSGKYKKHLGCKVSHIFGTGIFHQLKNGLPVVKWRTKCMRIGCKNKIRFMTKSGLHTGAWCYVVDRHGNYLANLRDDIAVCNKCAENGK